LNEVRSFVEAGLKDVSISRKTIKWGIPWPDDPEHVFYVWYDALTSYMSGIGYGEGEDGEANEKFRKFWPANLHMIGKEIIRFHAVYWPAFLMAAGLPLPERIFAHGWLLFEQEKMSKSKGNVAYPEPIVKVLGNDALRYYLLRETVFGQDGNFSREALITRYNADLANGLGNLASRTLTMINRYCGSLIPDPGDRFTASTRKIAELAAGDGSAGVGVCGHFDAFNFSQGLEAIWALISNIDSVLAAEKPWALAEDKDKDKEKHESNRQRVGDILYSAAEGLRFAVVLAHPAVPDATQRIWEQLGQSGKLADVRIDQLKWGGLKPGTVVNKPEAVFPRVEKKEAMERIEAMENEIRNPGAAAEPAARENKTDASIEPVSTPAAAAAAKAPGTQPSAEASKITIDDLMKVDLRVGLIKSAERIAGADKLLKLQVDIGEEVRQILAGIAMAYSPEELVGRKVVIVANLAPRKMRGLESNGMLLAASLADGKPVLCTFGEEIAPGAKVK
jgi:methionyl-tRNA synthetase